jgi:hypothetical protein
VLRVRVERFLKFRIWFKSGELGREFFLPAKRLGFQIHFNTDSARLCDGPPTGPSDSYRLRSLDFFGSWWVPKRRQNVSHHGDTENTEKMAVMMFEFSVLSVPPW